MRHSTKQPIPDSVLAVLRHRWRFPDGYSAFDSVFNDDPHRQRDPAYYAIERGAEVEQLEFQRFSHAEAIALIRDGVFGSVAVDQGSRVMINEHAMHALDDFLCEVYAQWGKYLDRMKLVEGACVVGPGGTH